MIAFLFKRRAETPQPAAHAAQVFDDFRQAEAFYVMLAVLLPNDRMMDMQDGAYYPHLHHAIKDLKGGLSFLDHMTDVKHKLNVELDRDLRAFNAVVLKNGMAFSSLKYVMQLPADIFFGHQKDFSMVLEKEKDNTRFKEWHSDEKLKSFVETLSRIEKASGQKFILKSRVPLFQPLMLKVV